MTPTRRSTRAATAATRRGRNSNKSSTTANATASIDSSTTTSAESSADNTTSSASSTDSFATNRCSATTTSTADSSAISSIDKSKPYVCDYRSCQKRFARSSQLQVHNRVHSGEKPYVCGQCGMRFTSGGNLKTHQRLHTGKREFECHLCNKTYPRADTLKRHMLSFHENRKLYSCPICHKSFKGHLRDHLRTHAKEDEDKPYACNQCGARFNQRSQLTVHIRVHTGERPYECKICARRFSHSTALKLHLRMHTGERPHVCKLCSKAFAQLPHLKKHMLCVHNTDKPYYCARCKLFFKIKVEFQSHVEQAHPQDVPEDLLDVLRPNGSNKSQENASKKVQEEQIDEPSGLSPVENVENKEKEVVLGDSLAGDANDKSVQEGLEVSSKDDEVVAVVESEGTMPLEKMRTLVALLLKKISTASRLKKLGFGTRLIDEVLSESIEASGRLAAEGDNERERLLSNVEILLHWTIPKEYMDAFKAEMKSVEQILEELAS